MRPNEILNILTNGSSSDLDPQEVGRAEQLRAIFLQAGIKKDDYEHKQIPFLRNGETRPLNIYLLALFAAFEDPAITDDPHRADSRDTAQDALSGFLVNTMRFRLNVAKNATEIVKSLVE